MWSRTQTSKPGLAAVAEQAAKSGHPAVRLESLTKFYGSGAAAVHALKNVGLEIWPGEFVVLLGPSGSGKSTLLNVVGGIERPTSAQVEVAGMKTLTPVYVACGILLAALIAQTPVLRTLRRIDIARIARERSL